MATRTPRPLTRDVLAKFLPDAESIRRFEQLFQEVSSTIPNDFDAVFQLLEENQIETGTAQGTANQANADIARIADALELIALSPKKSREIHADFDLIPPATLTAQQISADLAPPLSRPGLLEPDAVNFNLNAPRARAVGQLGWNLLDDTLDLAHSGGVTQQIGAELYVRFTNNTGVTIPNGTVVGLAYVGGVTTDNVVPFIANGSVPMLNIIGVTTQEVLATAQGRITVFGSVRDIDTTGAPFGQTWAAGDVLYASPAVAGGMSNLKPTAPAWAIPVAVVAVAHSTVGRIFVRPTIDQPLYYGEFQKTSDATLSAANTATAAVFDSAPIANGLSLGTPASRIIAAHSGLYKFTAQVQLVSNSASIKQSWYWFRKNGVDIANSSTIVTVAGAATVVAPSVSTLISLVAGDYVEVMWAADSTDVALDYNAATAFAPAAPSIILVVSQEQQ